MSLDRGNSGLPSLSDLPGLGQGDGDTTTAIVKLAVLAVGGQGGGVLTDWITELAERNGYRAQSTSVAGVAQRTGATIYYVEMLPDTGRDPVFSLSPAAGDVDIVIAAELMEAGRAVLRGFVTPDRTVLIASSHRILAVSEKIVPGDGSRDAAEVLNGAREAAKRLVAFDMERPALAAQSMISASLFGALSGSGALPFTKESFEEVIRLGGRGVAASLAAFDACHRLAESGDEIGAGAEPLPTSVQLKRSSVAGPARLIRQWNGLLQRVEELPEPVREMTLAGLRKVVDFQDVAYGLEYLDLVDRAAKMDEGESGWRLSIAAAKHAANAMTYDDVIRVADLKTRRARDQRIRDELNLAEDALLNVTEFLHPRMREICGTLPWRLGRWIEARPGLFNWLDGKLSKGRFVRSDRLAGYLSLWLLAALRPWRRRLLRHKIEAAHWNAWFDHALLVREEDYALGVEVLECRRLIKGYSDTHDRGLSKFDRVLSALALLQGREDAADWLRRLREAALLDEKGEALEGALKTIRTEVITAE
ncbi:MAG: indolepyruvate oxidoreductase subunit beta family protein [Proteobacteria bacterium]|nr:indolepyruvate oxidoreductase subunit beta family protein [Pseudomonadota bacterium]